MNYSALLEQITDYYANLLIIQYHDKPKAQATIKLIANMIWANMIILQVRDAFDVDTAIGNQLDIIGVWVGIDRFYNGIDVWEHNYLAYPYFKTIQDNSFDIYQGGFSTYSNFADNDGGFLMYKDWKDTRLKDNKMEDGDFRSLIKLKIIKNSINHTAKNIDDAIWKWSNGNVYTTWSGKELTYHFDNSYKQRMMLASYKRVLPRPTGCTLVLEGIQ